MMKKSIILKYLLLILLMLSTLSFSAKLRFSDHNNYTRVVIENNGELSYKIIKNGNQVSIRIFPEVDIMLETFKKSDRIIFLKADRKENFVDIVFKTKGDYDLKDFILKSPDRVVVDFFDKTSESSNKLKTERNDKPKEKPIIQNKQTKTNTEPNNNLVKEIRTIVIDPGHGGTEYGAKGPAGTYEKDITLKIAKILKMYIENYIGLQVYLTRNSDINLSLEERASFANNHKADIFISIHCNASKSKKAKGSETYILSLKATDKEARRLAFFENNFEEMPEDSQNTDDIKLILWDMAQTEYLRESANLAILIQKELNVLLKTKNRGIKQAPFRVLMNVAMPAVLVETAFISNPQEEKMLNDEKSQKKIAYAIFLGIKRYLIQNNE